MLPSLRALLALCLVLSGLAEPAAAAQSDWFRSDAVEASLVTATGGINPGAATLSAGLRVKLGDGWKTYWRTPGEVGIPPTIDWAGSENVGAVTFLWPAPHRFHAFGIENFGYKGEAVFPLSIALENPGAPVRLRARVSMLTCSLVCVPQDFDLALDLPEGGGLDAASAGLIADWAARVPLAGENAGVALDVAALRQGPSPALVVQLRSEIAFSNPDIFPEISERTTFGPPDIRLGDGGRLLWAEVPLTSLEEGAVDIALTVADGARAVSLERAALGTVPPDPPYEKGQVTPGLAKVLRMVAIALLGGLILNVMPCVLPVLSIKLTSAINVGAQGAGRVRAGFLMSAAGVMAFMWVLAGATLGVRALGLGVGWGIQFQNPVFLAAMAALVVLFAANMFGLFEINLPTAWNSRLAAASGQPTLGGDFATGAFAAVLATPCSAPFLGTAVAFALAGRAIDVAVIFSALGLGLALPYLMVAARPSLVAALPKPGRWMALVKAALGVLLLATAAWLLWVLMGVGGRDAAFGVTLLLVLATAALSLGLPARRAVRLARGATVSALLAAAVILPVAVAPEGGRAATIAENQKIGWVPFDRAAIAKRVSEGQVVFLDITADWCITCKANKTLVINRSPVADILNVGSVVAMQADWTRPDDRIAQFLAENDRYGIPFNAAYGPAAPDGVLLPELLTTALVLDALKQAAGSDLPPRTAANE